ncbi:hypothetical protein SLS55_010039 [Diplodia seriata]|uniref:F-box domain-containing protein n=1 Tax=Diplodia seriata TaxID=420778 RepID=A0ABR3C1Q7_9PEZI
MARMASPLDSMASPSDSMASLSDSMASPSDSMASPSDSMDSDSMDSDSVESDSEESDSEDSDSEDSDSVDSDDSFWDRFWDTPIVPDGPLTPSQQEIFLMDFPLCFNCQAGSCFKHGAAAGTASAVGDSIISAEAEKTRQALKLMTRLPAELQLEVVSNMDMCTFFNMLHTDQFKPLLVTHALAIYRALAHRFRRETEVFDAGFLTSRFWTGTLSMPRYYLLLEIIQKSTDAVMDHLITELELTPDFACRLRRTIMRLWRVIGTTGTADDKDDDVKLERFVYWYNLPKWESSEVLKCLRELGEKYEEVHPFPVERYQTGPDAELFAEFQQSGRFPIVLTSFIIEYVRVGMTKVFAQASQGKALDAADAFGRSGIAPWTPPAERPSYVSADEGYLGFDIWTYSVSWVYNDETRAETMDLDLPNYHRLDLFQALISIRTDMWDRRDSGPDWNKYSANAFDSRRIDTWYWRRPQEDDDPDGEEWNRTTDELWFEYVEELPDYDETEDLYRLLD